MNKETKKDGFQLVKEWSEQIKLPILKVDQEKRQLLVVIPGDGVLHQTLIHHDEESASLRLIVREVFSKQVMDEAFLKQLLVVNGKMLFGKFAIWDGFEGVIFEVIIPTTNGLSRDDFLRALAAVEETMKSFYLPLQKMGSKLDKKDKSLDRNKL